MPSDEDVSAIMAQKKIEPKKNLAKKGSKKPNTENQKNDQTKKKAKKEDQQAYLSSNQIQLPYHCLIPSLQEQTKKLKKKIAKTSKAPAKIKVKNKFFSDINIELQEQAEICEQKTNLIQQQLTKNELNESKNKNKELIIEKPKQTSTILNKNRLESIVNKTDFVRARHDYKKVDQDSKFRAYVKQKLQQVQDVQQVIISELEVPQIHRSKLISSSIYLAHESSKKQQSKIFDQNETAKKMTAEDIIKERKMLKNRTHFYKRLSEQIKQQKITRNKDCESETQLNSKFEKTKGCLQSENRKKIQQIKRKQDKILENNQQSDKTFQNVLTEYSTLRK